MALRPRKRLAQNYGHRRKTAPAEEPVTLAEMQTLLRDPPAEETGFINLCIEQARSMFEAVTGIACITQVWTLVLDDWYEREDDWWDGVRQLPVSELGATGRLRRYIEMPRYPLQSVDSLLTYAADDTTTSVTITDVFVVDTETFPGRLALRSGATWPVVGRLTNGVEIEYTAGFGDTAVDVPETIKRAIQQLAAFLYENRGDGCTPTAALRGSGALQIAAEYVTLRV